MRLQQAQQKTILNQYDESEVLIKDAIRYFELDNDINYQGYAYNELGFLADRKGLYDDAMMYNMKAVKLFDEAGNLKESANSTGNLAIVYYRLGQTDKALTMFHESAKVRNRIGDIKGLAAIYGNIATVYLSVNLDSAEKYYSLQLQNATLSGVKLNIAQAYVNKSMLLERMGLYESALENEEKAVGLYSEIGENSKLGFRYAALALLFQHIGDTAKAEDSFSKARKIGIEWKNKPVMQNYYRQQSIYYKNKGDWRKAYNSIETYYLYRDSLSNEKTSARIAELETQYEVEKKNSRIEVLEANARIHELEMYHQQTEAYRNMLEIKNKQQAIVLLTKDKEHNSELLEKKELALENARQQLLLEHQKQQITEQDIEKEKLVRHIIAGFSFTALLTILFLFSRFRLKRKLEEKNRILKIRDNISRDLHDEVGSTLSSINLLSIVSRKALQQGGEKADEMLELIENQSKAIQNRISDIVWAIRPENERIENMEIRMREFIAQTLEAANIKTRFNFDRKLDNVTLSYEVRKNMMLIYKEAVNNIIKHSGASQAEIELSCENGLIVLSVSDNGVGVKSVGNSKSGLGLKSIEQRSKEIGGICNVISSEDGTKVVLKCPIP